MIAKNSPEQKKKDKKDIGRSFLRYTNQMANTVLRGVKMASPSLTDPHIHPLAVLEILKSLGPSALSWKPEVLFSALDKETDTGEALQKFHEIGEIYTKIPPINRHKVYALRIIMTSDTAHREWNVFEKVGSAFNGRLAHFGVIEPLTPIECATTVALINSIRPDTFSEEVICYIAASCQIAGLYTVAPCKWLSFAEEKLQVMNKSETGRTQSPEIVNDITNKLDIMSKGHFSAEESFSDIQALRLLALNKAGDDAIISQ